MRSLFALFRSRKRRRPQRPWTARPWLERLEDRLAPAFRFGSAFALGDTNSDTINSLVADNSGNTYVTGSFRDTVDFDPGAGVFDLTSTGDSSDIFVAKYTSAGALAWAERIGGIEIDSGRDIAQDAAGNLYVLGFFDGTVDFDPGPGTFNLTGTNGHAFILKLTGNGGFVFAKQLDLQFDTRSIAADSAGNLYITGDFDGTVDFDPGPGVFNLTSAGHQDVFVSKLDANGNFVWAKRFGDLYSDAGLTVAVDAQGNVYTAGVFRGTVDWDPGPGVFNLTSAGDPTNDSHDMYALKLDPNGNFVWAVRAGSTHSEQPAEIALDGLGNVYIGGWFHSFGEAVDFDPGPGEFNLTNGEQYDGFVWKLDSAGHFVWAKLCAQGTASGYVLSIALDPAGNVYSTGGFSGIADFDPGPGTFNLSAVGDPFIAKLDTDGNFVAAVALVGSQQNNDGFDIALDGSGNVYTVGRFTETIDCDPGPDTFNLTTGVLPDGYLLKLTQPATLAITGLTSPIAAGTANDFTLTAKDWLEQTLTGYAATVQLTSNDPQAIFVDASTGQPLANNRYTFTVSDTGRHAFRVILRTVGTHSITAADTVFPEITGTASVTVTPAAASMLVVAGFPSPSTAGVAGTFAVTARDPFGNVATGYTGTVTFTSSDPQAARPANYTFVAADAGVHTFSAGLTLRTAGTQSVTATDTVTAGITGSQTGIVVTPAAASTLVVAGFPSPVTAGSAGSLTVTAQDPFGNTATGYRGTVRLTSGDGQAGLPADYAFTAADAGTTTFTATLRTAGTQALTATDTVTASITGSQTGIVVQAAATSRFVVVGFPALTTAGAASNFTVIAQDTYGNVTPDYRGTVRFTSSDARATLPGDYTFVAGDQGRHTFNATLRTAGSYTITATDTAAAGTTGFQAGIFVLPAGASTLVVSGFPSPTTAGVAGDISVTARDPFGNVATGYTGTVVFASSDPRAVLPAAYTFGAADAGAHTFPGGLTFKTTGTQSVTATDTVTAAITGSQTGIVVTPAAADVLVVAGFPSPATAGDAGSFTVTARDAFGNTATGYRGSVRLTSSDGQAALPGDYTFTAAAAGTATFTAILKTAGSQSLTAADTAVSGITGSQTGLVISPAATSVLVVAGFPSPATAGVAGPFSVTARDAFGNTTPAYRGSVRFTSSDGQAVLPGNHTFTAADAGTAAFTATLRTAGTQSLTATDTATAGITGSQAGIAVNPVATTTTITSAAPRPSTFGQAVTFTATVTPAEVGLLPAGTITFREGTTVLGQGTLANVSGAATATFTTGATQLASGSHTITALFTPADGNYLPSTSAGFTQAVNAAATTTTVTAAAPRPSTFGQAVTFTAMVTPAVGGGVPAGTVTFREGSLSLGQGTLSNVGGVATASFTTAATQLAGGAHLVTAVLAPAGGNFVPSTSAGITQTVNAAATTTAITAAVPGPSTFGQAVTFTATVSPTLGSVRPAGTITFRLGSTVLGSRPLADVGGVATATFTTTATQLAGGGHSVTAVFAPADSNYAASTSAAFAHSVNPAATTSTITAANPSPSTFGQAVTFTATVTPGAGGVLPAGTVTFREGAMVLGQRTLTNVGGVATATLTTSAAQLTGGSHALTAAFTPAGGNFAASTSAGFGVTVSAAATAITITQAVPASPAFGQAVTFTATVTPTLGGVRPAGTVTFREGANTLGQGTLVNVGGVATAAFTTAATQLAGGGHAVTALFTPADGNYAASTAASFGITVGAAATTTTITQAAPVNPAFGQAVTLTATVAPTPGGVLPAGTVTFREGSITLGQAPLTNVGGVASATFTTTVTQLLGGDHVLRAEFTPGDANYAASTAANFSLTVRPAATTTTITHSTPASPSPFGQAVTFTATVSPTIGTFLPAGTVTFRDGAVTLGQATLANVDGMATATITTTAASRLSGGSHAVTAAFTPAGGNFATSTSAAFTHTVAPAATTTTVTRATPSAPVFGQPLTLTATVGPTVGGVAPTGTVTFRAGPTTLGQATLANVGGVATATFTTGPAPLAVGTLAVTAVYNPDSSPNYAGSTSSDFPLTVSPAASTTTITQATPGSPTVGQAVTFTVTVGPAFGGVRPTGTVTFRDGTTPLGTATLGNVVGTATATFTTGAGQLAAGGHVITADFTPGDGNYAASTSANINVTVSPAATTTTLTQASPASPTFGPAVTFTATVAPSLGALRPTGTVTFQSNAVTLGSGTLAGVGGVATATFTTALAQLGGGSHVVTAIYNPGTDPNFTGSFSAGFPLTVRPAATVTAITQSTPVSPTRIGQAVTFTATVTPNQGAALPEGTVTFRDGTLTLGSGGLANIGGVATATLTTGANQLGAGAHTITASFGPADGDFAASTCAGLTHQVNPPPVISSLSPSEGPEKTVFPLTVHGANFLSSAVVMFNGVALPTTFVSSTQLQATVVLGAIPDEGVYPVTVVNPDPGGGTSNTLSFTAVVRLLPDGTRGTADQRWLSEVYDDLLNRPIDQGGLDYWGGLLSRGVSRLQIVTIIVAQPEYRGIQVQGLYRRYLRRDADAAGLAQGIAALQRGATVEQLAAGLVSSAEYFQARGGGTVDGFLDALYQDALGRAVDPSGLAFGRQAFAAGGAARVAAGVLGSDEYRAGVVQGIFTEFLHRQAEPAAVGFYVGQLRTGMRVEQLVALIVASQEFYNRTAA